MGERPERPTKKHVRKTVDKLFPTGPALNEQIESLQRIIAAGGPLAEY